MAEQSIKPNGRYLRFPIPDNWNDVGGERSKAVWEQLQEIFDLVNKHSLDGGPETISVTTRTLPAAPGLPCSKTTTTTITKENPACGLIVYEDDNLHMGGLSERFGDEFHTEAKHAAQEGLVRMLGISPGDLANIRRTMDTAYTPVCLLTQIEQMLREIKGRLKKPHNYVPRKSESLTVEKTDTSPSQDQIIGHTSVDVPPAREGTGNSESGHKTWTITLIDMADLNDPLQRKYLAMEAFACQAKVKHPIELKIKDMKTSGFVRVEEAIKLPPSKPESNSKPSTSDNTSMKGAVDLVTAAQSLESRLDQNTQASKKEDIKSTLLTPFSFKPKIPRKSLLRYALLAPKVEAAKPQGQDTEIKPTAITPTITFTPLPEQDTGLALEELYNEPANTTCSTPPSRRRFRGSPVTPTPFKLEFDLPDIEASVEREVDVEQDEEESLSSESDSESDASTSSSLSTLTTSVDDTLPDDGKEIDTSSVLWDEDDDLPVKPANNTPETEGQDTVDAGPQPGVDKNKEVPNKAARLMNELILTLSEAVDRNRLYREENATLQEKYTFLQKEIRQAEEELETLERIKEMEANDLAIQRDKLAEEYSLLAKEKKEVQQLFEVYERKQKRFKKRLAGLMMIGDDREVARTGETVVVQPSSKHPKGEADEGKRKCSCAGTGRDDAGDQAKAQSLDVHVCQQDKKDEQDVTKGPDVPTPGSVMAIREVERNWHAWAANLMAFLQLLVTIYCLVT